MARYKIKSPRMTGQEIKEVYVEACQWNGHEEGPHNLGVLPYDLPTMPNQGRLGAENYGLLPRPASVKKHGIEAGLDIVKRGDYIITDTDGASFRCGKDFFEQHYRLI
jgi:hypothetical protein